MRLLAWNLNHRAHCHAVPGWIREAIVEKQADAVVLTEYVVGPDHLTFVESLRDAGLRYASVSKRVNKSNQLLIATREPHRLGAITAPTFNESVPPNFLHVVIETLGVDVVGFRMPAFTSSEKQFKRLTWDWLINAIGPLCAVPCIVAGDFNTALGDSARQCGDCFEQLRKQGWLLADPGQEAVSYRSRLGSGRLIDHAFASPLLAPLAAQCSWDFHKFGPDAQTGRFGRPDHAMLIVDTPHASR